MRARRAARLSRRRFLALGAGLAGAAVLGGCGDPDGTAAQGATPTPTRAPEPVGLRVRHRLRAPKQADVALHLGVISAPDTATGVFARDERLLVYSRLVGLDPRQPAAYADLAREIEFVEPLLLRMTLDPNARFHTNAAGDVHSLTAESVARDFERRAAEGVYLFDEVIEQVETPEDGVLAIRLRAPFALLFELLARPEASIRGDSDYAVFGEPVGSGAFVPVVREDWGHAYAANPIWHGGDIGLSGIAVAHAEQERELDAAFTRRELDVRQHPDADSRTATAARRDAVRLTRASRRQRGLGLSLLGRKEGRAVRHLAAFQDHRVRRAVSLGLDREALTEIDGSMLSGPVGPAHTGDALPQIELQAHPLYRRDPAEARALLAAAEAEELAFRIQHPDTSGMLLLARLVSQQLREAGFDPRPTAVPPAEWEAAFVRGDFEAAIFELTALDTPDLGLRLHTSGGLRGRFSLWGYSDPVYDAAVRAALSEIDPARRARRSREAQRMLLDRVPAMFPLAAPRDHASIAPSVHGFEFNAYDFNAGYLAPSWTVVHSGSDSDSEG